MKAKNVKITIECESLDDIRESNFDFELPIPDNTKFDFKQGYYKDNHKGFEIRLPSGIEKTYIPKMELAYFVSNNSIPSKSSLFGEAISILSENIKCGFCYIVDLSVPIPTINSSSQEAHKRYFHFTRETNEKELLTWLGLKK